MLFYYKLPSIFMRCYAWISIGQSYMYYRLKRLEMDRMNRLDVLTCTGVDASKGPLSSWVVAKRGDVPSPSKYNVPGTVTFSLPWDYSCLDTVAATITFSFPWDCSYSDTVLGSITFRLPSDCSCSVTFPATATFGLPGDCSGSDTVPYCKMQPSMRLQLFRHCYW